ncbi:MULTISPECIES: AMP-binding protein [unclassified Nocardiopsis]|uniref:AMP-binding protein n=1 Tax=unclassified Nocardiopsis TaxID=2649073 RepID=UPI00135B2797
MLPADATLPHLLERNAADRPEAPALAWREPGTGEWSTLTWSLVRDRITELAEGYAAPGVRPGDHVLLMMANRPEHWLSDLALVHTGAVPTTVYGTSAPEQVAHIARHSRARLAVVENPDLAAAWEGLLGDPGTPLGALMVVDGAEPARGHTDYAILRGAPGGPAAERWRGRGPGDLFTVVHTSGTPGDPKGEELYRD